MTSSVDAQSHQQPLQTILFLHAFPLNADMWHPQIGVVRRMAHHCAGLSRFGHSSPSDSPRCTMNDLAGDAIDLLDRLNHGGCWSRDARWVVTSLSSWSKARPTRQGLVLIDTRAGADTEDGKASRRKMLETVDKSGSEAIASEMTPNYWATRRSGSARIS